MRCKSQSSVHNQYLYCIRAAFRDLTFLPDDTPEQTEEKDRQLQELGERYSWKADRYDPALLYAKLTTGLTRGFALDYCFFGKDNKGNPITFDQLMGVKDDRAVLITTFLLLWARELETKGLTVMATQFKAPASPDGECSANACLKFDRLIATRRKKIFAP